jgi:hypothetical protein
MEDVGEHGEQRLRAIELEKGAYTAQGDSRGSPGAGYGTS